MADAVATFAKTSAKNVLICWEHDALTDIVESLGVDKDDAPDYPDDSSVSLSPPLFVEELANPEAINQVQSYLDASR